MFSLSRHEELGDETEPLDPLFEWRIVACIRSRCILQLSDCVNLYHCKVPTGDGPLGPGRRGKRTLAYLLCRTRKLKRLTALPAQEGWEGILKPAKPTRYLKKA
jgi:hypothetical protein